MAIVVWSGTSYSWYQRPASPTILVEGLQVALVGDSCRQKDSRFCSSSASRSRFSALRRSVSSRSLRLASAASSRALRSSSFSRSRSSRSLRLSSSSSARCFFSSSLR